MHALIKNPIVGENILSFIAVLRKTQATEKTAVTAGFEKKYCAFLHSKTGQLIFAERHKDHTEFSSPKWRGLYLEYSYNQSREAFQAIAYEQVNSRESFPSGDLSPLALNVLKETLAVINHFSSLLKGAHSDLATKIKAFCQLRIEIKETENRKNLLVAAWHSLDRVGAEKALKNKPVGTFLFRKDHFATLLSDQLSKELGKEVKCITLTLVEWDKISDFTLVHIDHQWRWYNDVLFCDVQGFLELEDLLNAYFKDRAKEPLLHVEVEERIA